MLYSAGFALGPIIAGLLVARFGWPSVFWFRAPVTLAAFAATLALPRSPRREAGQRFDAAGAALLILGISAALLAIDRLQHLAAGAAWALAAAVVATALLGGFAWQERRAKQPIIDLGCFAIPGLARVTVVGVLVNLACFAVLLLLPFHLARVLALGPRAIGLVLASSALGMVLASPLAGALAGRIGSWSLAAAGCVGMAAGLGGVAANPALGLLLVALLAQGFGQGLFQVAFLDIITASLPPEARGVAGSLGMLSRTVGVVLGASLLTLAFRSLLASPAPAAFLPAFQGVFAMAAALPAGCALALAPPRGRRG